MLKLFFVSLFIIANLSNAANAQDYNLIQTDEGMFLQLEDEAIPVQVVLTSSSSGRIHCDSGSRPVYCRSSLPGRSRWKCLPRGKSCGK